MNCKFCGGKMEGVGDVSYAQNPYCNECLDERLGHDQMEWVQDPDHPDLVMPVRTPPEEIDTDLILGVDLAQGIDYSILSFGGFNEKGELTLTEIGKVTNFVPSTKREHSSIYMLGIPEGVLFPAETRQYKMGINSCILYDSYGQERKVIPQTSTAPAQKHGRKPTARELRRRKTRSLQLQRKVK